jgi:outer membrane protein assembly factor BamB
MKSKAAGVKSNAAGIKTNAAVVLRGALLASSLLLAGCSSMPSMNPMDWFRPSNTGPKPAELPALSNPQAVRVLWSTNIGRAENFAFSPRVVGDSVYVAGRDGSVARLDAATGQPRWRTQAGSRLSAGVGSDGQLVVVASDEGEVFAFDAQSGALRWRARVSSEVLASPDVSDGMVLVRSADSRLFALNADDGKRRWVYQRSAVALTVRTPAGLTARSGAAFAGFPGGRLVAVSLANGNAAWEAAVAAPRGATELERVTDVVGEPALLGREVCAAAYQGRVACYDAQTGNAIWAREASTLTGVSVDNRYAYLSDVRGSVQALDRSSGQSVWKQDRLSYRQLSLPLPLGAEVVVGDLQGYVHFLARDSGAFLTRIATDGSAIRAAPIRLPNGILVQTLNGGIYALSL